MPLTLKLSATSVLDSSAEVIALGVTESPLDKQKALVALDAALKNKLLAHAAKSKFTGGNGQILDVPTLGLVAAGRVVLIGMGKSKRGPDAPSLRAFAAAAARQAISAASLAIQLPEKAAGAPLLLSTVTVLPRRTVCTRRITGSSPRTGKISSRTVPTNSSSPARVSVSTYSRAP